MGPVDEGWDRPAHRDRPLQARFVLHCSALGELTRFPSFDFAALFLGRTAGAGFAAGGGAAGHAEPGVRFGFGWALVFVKPGSLGLGQGLVAQFLHDENPGPVSNLHFDLISNCHLAMRLYHLAVDPDPTEVAGSGCLAASLEDPCHLQPLVESNLHRPSVAEAVTIPTMLRSQKRLLALVVSLAVLVVVSALLYMLGMSYLEGQERGFWRSLEFAAETLSTTGYGDDGSWNSPVMSLFVILLQFIGVFLIFLVFPIYLIPFLEERFEIRLPKEVPELRDHVIIYRYGPGVATLLDELASAGVETVIIEPDESQARRLLERGHRVLHGNLDEGALRKVSLDRARSLIANSSDDEDAAVILGARQLGYQGEALALVEEPLHRKAIMLAGATATYTPNHMLGAALAARASQMVSPTVANVQQLGRRLQVSEVRIPRGSSLAGKTLAEAGLGQRTGVSVIGQWVGGRLITPPTAGMRLEPDGILIMAGSVESVQRFEEVCGEATPLRRQGPFVVAGYGEVGRKVVQLLTDVGEEVVVIDGVESEGVTLVGDALDSRILEEAAVAHAQAVIMALDTDSATMFATVIVKDLAPDVPVIARVNRAENVERIHRAGADFALSISQVSGQILARRLLGEETVSVDPQLKVMRVAVSGLEGQNPVALRIREKTGCSIVAVERGEHLLTDFDAGFRFEADDAIYLCGSSRATRAFIDTYPSTGEPSRVSA